MGGTNIKLTINDADLRRALEKLNQLGRNKTELFEVIGEDLINSTKDRFDDSESPDGEKWAELKPKSIAKKNKKGK